MSVFEDFPFDKQRSEIPCVVKEAFWDQLASSVVIGNDNLLPLGVYILSKQLAHMHEVGERTVAGDQIKGIVGMSSDFDEAFMPRQSYIRHWWTDEDQLRFHDAALPLIKLLKIEDSYFVIDGHHRLSVKSIHQQQAVKAQVIEIEPDQQC